jgi:FkbM family methyltransferase
MEVRVNGAFERDYDLESLEKITVKTFGFEMYVSPRCRSRYAEETYEELTSMFVRQAARKVETFVDVGAHYGFFSILVGRANPDCRVLAIEPVAENAQILSSNLGLNGIIAEVHEAAASNMGGRAQFEISQASDNSGLVANPAAGILRRVTIEVVCLDRLFERIGSGPVMVKIDTEGNELRVLEGMERILREHEDVRLIVAVNPSCLEANGTTADALLGRLDFLGFDVNLVVDSTRQYVRLGRNTDWETLLGERACGNLVCVKKARALNLCVFSHTAELGGAESALLETTAEMISRYGTIFTAVLPCEGPLQKRLADLGAATMLAEYRWWYSAASGVDAGTVDDWMGSSHDNVMGLLTRLATFAPDMILTNTLVIPWGAVAAMKLECPHVWWIHEFGQLDPGFSFFYERDRVLKTILESSNHVVVNSEAVRSALFNDVPAQACSVAYQNLVLPDEAQCETSYFTFGNSFKIAIAGRVTESKGQDDAVQAMEALSARGYDVELCVAGSMLASDHYGRALMERANADSLAGRVHFLGFLENVRPLMEQAQVMLTCSRNEAFGRVTAEAMLLGKPVIGTRYGGTVELIDDGITGFLYDPGDSGQLADRIAFFMDHSEQVREFGGRAKARIREKLSAHPADARLFDLGQSLKGHANPKSKRLSCLVAGWQTGAEARLLVRLLEKEQVLQATRDELGTLGARLVALQGEFDERTAWALQLDAELQQRQRELAAIKSSALWRAGKALHRQPRSDPPRRT